MRPLSIKAGLCSSALFLAPAIALANMGNLGSNYGLLPSDLGSAQALSMFNTQVSSVYYNPAYLTHDLRGELTAGLMHIDANLKADSDKFGTYTVQDDPSQQILLGLKTDLSDITEFGQPIALGIMLGTEKFGQEMLAFSSHTAAYGQYFKGGRQPLFLNVGMASTIYRGLDVGASIVVTLRNSATLVTNTDLAGNTDYESLDVSAKPTLRPILSLNMDWGETLCPDAECWYNGLETAFAFRGHSDASVSVEANTIIPGTIPDPGLFLNIATVDAYQPNVYALGTQWRQDRWRVGVTVEMQQWSDLEDELVNDTVKQNSGLEFKDTVIPRIGVEYQLTDMIGVTAGVAFEESPLDSTDNPEVNYLDADRTVFGLGLSSTFAHVYGMRYPVRVDLGYQYHLLDKRTFHVTSSQTGNDDYVETKGDVNVFGGSISMKF
jgi:hypothetical protein